MWLYIHNFIYLFIFSSWYILSRPYLAYQVRYILDVSNLSGLTIIQACCPNLISLHAIFNLMISVFSYYLWQTRSNKVFFSFPLIDPKRKSKWIFSLVHNHAVTFDLFLAKEWSYKWNSNQQSYIPTPFRSHW